MLQKITHATRRQIATLLGALIAAVPIVTIGATPAAVAKSCSPVNLRAVNALLQNATAHEWSEEEVSREVAKRWCLTKVSIDAPEPLASPDDVDWNYITMYWDNQQGAYLAHATWTWVNEQYREYDYLGCNINNDIGGSDGVGIRFSGGGINIISKVADAWGNPAKNSYSNDYGTIGVPHSVVNDYGVGFIAQDKGKKLYSGGGLCLSDAHDYNMYAGAATITFKRLNGCANAQMYPGYIHTWDTTAITSLGGGVGAFSVGWANPGSSWERAENGPSAMICS